MLKRTKQHRSLTMETLDSRLVLSGTGMTDDHIVQQQGDVVFVFGGQGDDVIEVEMGRDSYSVMVNGEDHSFAANDVAQIVISGLEGQDEVNVAGSDLDDRIEVLGDEIEMLSQEYAVRVRAAELVRYAGSGGVDRVKIYDTPGDDELFMHHDFATFVNESGDTFKVSGVERVEAFAENGGHDRVNFYDSDENDRFVGKPGFSFLVGNGFWNYAKGFQRVDFFRRMTGKDEARLYGSDDDDQLQAQPGEVVLTVGATVLAAHDVPVTRTFAGGGNDTARVMGQDHVTDMFVWEPTSSYMFTTGEFSDPSATETNNSVSPVTSSNVMVGFELIEAEGSDDTDRAELRGSAENDNYIALPQVVELTTPGATVEATDFRIVRAFGRGGDDHAHLQDSDFNDTYISNEVFAYLEGRDYLNYVSGFRTIDVSASNGGYDYANPRDYHGPGNDHLIHDGFQFLIFGPERNERIFDFSEARGDGNRAGLAAFRSIEFDFTLGGSHDPFDDPISSEDVETIRARLAAEWPIYDVVDGNIQQVDSTTA